MKKSFLSLLCIGLLISFSMQPRGQSPRERGSETGPEEQQGGRPLGPPEVPVVPSPAAPGERGGPSVPNEPTILPNVPREPSVPVTPAVPVVPEGGPIPVTMTVSREVTALRNSLRSSVEGTSSATIRAAIEEEPFDAARVIAEWDRFAVDQLGAVIEGVGTAIENKPVDAAKGAVEMLKSSLTSLKSAIALRSIDVISRITYFQLALMSIFVASPLGQIAAVAPDVIASLGTAFGNILDTIALAIPGVPALQMAFDRFLLSIRGVSEADVSSALAQLFPTDTVIEDVNETALQNVYNAKVALDDSLMKSLLGDSTLPASMRISIQTNSREFLRNLTNNYNIVAKSRGFALK
jgi:hypothetical protein